MTPLYLSDSESRQALTGSLLVARPYLPDTRAEFAPWGVGDVVLAREAWAVAICDSENGGTLYRADCQSGAAPADLSRGASARWRPAPQMPEWAVRHRLRVAKVECRRVDSLTEAEAIQTGIAPIVHAKPDDASIHRSHLWAFGVEWDKRHGKKAPPWSDGLVWFVMMEAAP